MSGDSTSSLLSSQALELAAKRLQVQPDEIIAEAVSGGFSLNRRAIVRGGGSTLFVKEVDESLLEGDGSEERAWLKKDHGVMELLRSEGYDFVPEWSWLSDDSQVLMMTAYPEDEGWHWSLPEDKVTRERYIQAVVDTTKLLEKATFSDVDMERLSLQPYFRDKIANKALYAELMASPQDLRLLSQKYAQLNATEKPHLTSLLEQAVEVLQKPRLATHLEQMIEDLAYQPNEVIGHCDVRSDNLAYHEATGKIILVDWNWTSVTPRQFGSTEFLVSVAQQGADVSRWQNDLNQSLLAGLVIFWWVSCLGPEIGGNSSVRDHQAVAAAVAYSLLNKLEP